MDQRSFDIYSLYLWMLWDSSLGEVAMLLARRGPAEVAGSRALAPAYNSLVPEMLLKPQQADGRQLLAHSNCSDPSSSEHTTADGCYYNSHGFFILSKHILFTSYGESKFGFLDGAQEPAQRELGRGVGDKSRVNLGQ